MGNEDSVIVIFSAEKNKNSLKHLANLILLLDNKSSNKNKIVKAMNKIGAQCVSVSKADSNSNIVKMIESGDYTEYSEQSVLDFLSCDIKITLYFKVYEEQNNHNLFNEEVLCPFLLYRARGFNECILVIYPDSSRGEQKPSKETIQEITNPISRYMYYESLCKQTEWKNASGADKETDKICIEPTQKGNDYYDQCFIYIEGRTIRLTRNFKGKNKNIVNVMPLIKLNHNSYSVLSQSVEECFEKVEKFKADWLEYDLYKKIGEKFYEFGEKRITDFGGMTREKYHVKNIKLYEKYLLAVMIQSICMNSLRSFENYPEEEDICTVFESCRHMSLLAFLFFTSYCKEVNKNEWTSWENSAVVKLINLSQDYADGILQIIENAKEYANVGYMNYHIIDIESERRIMLKKRYQQFFDQSTDVKFFLQIQIIDMGRSDIVSTFVKNNNIFNGDHGISKLVLKDFFTPLNENCKKEFHDYYGNVRNITQHYGLRQFVSMVQSGKGYFEVSSTQKCKVRDSDRYSNFDCMVSSGIHVPGTEYKIFLPVQYAEKAEQKAVGIGAELDYNDTAIKNKWECKVINNEEIMKENEYLGCMVYNQQDKVDKIEQLAEYLNEKETEGRKRRKRKILCIDVNSFKQMWQIEILTKAVLLYIAEGDKIRRIALYNATRSFMMNFTRYLCNFYNNIAGIISSSKINSTQIYVCKDDYSIDLGFMGNNLLDAFVICDYLARTRGVFNDCLELIQSLIQDNGQVKKKQEAVKFAPFDLLINLEEGSLFEKRVKSDLQKDVQDVAFGCCLHDAHMKVGSKMHITDKFFDATLLFASGYYTSRFAYILSKKIASICPQQTEKLTLVGYENFSELLLTETRRLLNELYEIKDVDYIIFEQGIQNEFKFVEEDKNWYADRKFVVIVPVGCTLTTHSKIESEIRSNIYDAAIVLMNLTVIVIRNKKRISDIDETAENKPRGIENRYWKAVDIKDRIITTKMTNPDEVYYNVLISNEWENPLHCSACFPPSDHPEREKPMLTMSYTSVIPMVLIGLKKQYSRQKNVIEDIQKSNNIKSKLLELNNCVGNINMLKECMIYGHIENGSNHFEYYFETELLMKKIYETKSNNEFSTWIMKLKNIIQTYNQITSEEQNCEEYIYDILVAPMNRTNATFVEYINMHAFENVPIIVYIDANREFRDNIKTKYSNLTALYYNLMMSNKNAVINFHYIDDCIISGTTFYRTKSLLQSLFPPQAFTKQNKVYVDIFQNVIVLLNRCSNSTKLNYAHEGHFFSYIDVHISSMRTHHDKACVLCENVNHYKLLRDCSSTNKMAEEWNRKLKKNEVKPIERSREIYIKGLDTLQIRDRHYRRLYCANYLSEALDQLGDEKNNTTKVKIKILEIINQSLKNPMQEDNLSENLEVIISYFKVSARPFIVFRKSVLEAIFAILIETMEKWGNTNGEELDNISITINQSIEFIKSGRCNEEFVKCLEGLYRSIISLLSALGSKYLVRKDSYYKLMHNDPMRLVKSASVEDTILPFELFYAAHIKRMITLNKDETIGLWFENLLINGCEIRRDGEMIKDEDFIQTYGIKSDFGKMLFLENTYIIFQAVSLIYAKLQRKIQKGELRGNIEDEVEDTMSNFRQAYYYENYRSLAQCGSNDQTDFSKLQEETKQMVLLFAHLKENVESGRNVVEYYETLARKLERVSGADNVLIYGGNRIDDNGDVYEIVQKNQKNVIDYTNIIIDMCKKRGGNVSNQLQENIIICSKDSYVIVKIDSNSEWRRSKEDKPEESDYSDDIFCVFKYNHMHEPEMGGYEILRRMRNILVFRHTMMERFRNDFHNNAFKVFMEQKHRNELIASIKAVSHTSNETLKYVTQEMEYMSRNDLNVYAAYMLQLAADSLISRLYVERIQGGGAKKMIAISDFGLTDQLLAVLGELRYYSDEDMISDGKYTGLTLDNKAHERIRWEMRDGHEHYRILFITAVLYNALQHGLADQVSRKIRVEIFEELREGIHYLCFKNMTRYFDMNVFKHNVESGITIKALEYYYEYYLNQQISKGPIQEESGIAYRIDLPICEEEGSV